MISKELSHAKRELLNAFKGIIYDTYVKIETEFKNLLKQNKEFDAGGYDYQVYYTGCDFPMYCDVEKIYLSEDGNTIYVELKDRDNEDDVFDVPITDLEPRSMYGEHICNLYGLAIDYFTSK